MRWRTIVLGLGVVVLGWFLADAAARVWADRRASGLIRVVAGDDARAREEAIRSLGEMGPSAGSAAARALREGGPREREAGLLACDQVVWACLINFSTMNCVTGYVPGRGAAERAFEEVGAALDAALAGGDAKVRHEAARIILAGRKFAEHSRRRAAAVLGEAMRDPDPAARRAVVEAMCLRRYGGSAVGAAEVIPILAETIKDPDSAVRRAAVEALDQGGSREAAPVLVEALKDPEPSVRRAAERACIREDYNPSFPPESFDKYARDLRAPFRADLSYFIDWLRHGDPEAGPDRRHFSRHRAVVAIRTVGGREVIAPLADAFRDSIHDGDGARRRLIAAALEDLAKDADCFAALGDHVPELTEGLTGFSEADVRSVVASILRRSAPATDAAVAILIARLGNPNLYRRMDAIYDLGWLGASSGKAREALRRVEAEDADPRARRVAHEALARSSGDRNVSERAHP